MVGWHHQLNGHEFEQTPGDSEGHNQCHSEGHAINLACCMQVYGVTVINNLVTEQQHDLVICIILSKHKII